ncbi:MAG: hypothetical protein HZA95_03005 [Candidatus Vogelbacteria bacterium]|nr:hypothetical protein [Candidatus Vogelbacteria bacterium]
METEILELLKKNIALNEANHKLLLSIRGNARLGTFLKILYWLVILGGIGYAYLQLEPYLNTVIGAYNQIQSTVGEFNR